MIEALSRPMIDLLEEVGSGHLAEGDAQGDRLLTAGCDGLRTAAAVADRALTAAGPALSEAMTTAASGLSQALTTAGSVLSSGAGLLAGGPSGGPGWSGGAAGAAGELTAATIRSADALARHGEQLDALLQRALDAIRRAVAELTEVIATFVATASAAAPTLMTPAGAIFLINLAIEHLGRATTIIVRLRSELSGFTAEAGGLIEPPTLPSVPGSGDPVSALTAGINGATELASTGIRALGGALDSAIGGGASEAPANALPGATPEAGGGSGSALPTTGSGGGDPGSSAGGGLTVSLPDGTVVQAPNETAATAVREALTQQGVPYQWGGTTPGSGLDCSGLTQWAYGEAGLDLPRLAQEQGIGTPIATEELMPGDLAVWDGHVAMVIGNGQMIEAGDPVSISPVRTSNIGMTFHGFYRPSA